MKKNKNKINMNKVLVHVWDLKGYVGLKNNFIHVYENELKKYGVSRMLRELGVTYSTLADTYRKNKLISIILLEKICIKLGIDKKLAEESIVCFTENRKTCYEMKFPIDFTPLTLRAVSMIIGDGCGSVNRVCCWVQHKRNIDWGAALISFVSGHEPKIKHKENSAMFTIPRFLVRASSNILGREFSKTNFLEDICNLPRYWRFQVFAQLVVDEGSPDADFKIFQSNNEILNGIEKLVNSLGYVNTKYNRLIYISTESLPAVKKDLEDAKRIFGKLGGFWFKDERFEKALECVDPEFSKIRRINNEKFDNVIRKIRKKGKTVSYNELNRKVGIPDGSFLTRVRRAIRNGSLIKIRYGLYTFPEYKNDKNIRWLLLSKEEKVLKVLKNKEYLMFREIKELTNLSETQLYRAIHNLFGCGKMQKIGTGKYTILSRNASFLNTFALP